MRGFGSGMAHRCVAGSEVSCVIQYQVSPRRLCREGTRLYDPLLYLVMAGNAVSEMFSLIGLFKLGSQCIGFSMLQLFDGLDAALFQEIGHFRADALEAHQTGAVVPFSKLLRWHPNPLGELRLLLVGLGTIDQVVHRVYLLALEFGRVLRTDTLDLANFVRHIAST